ncbi:MAG: MFS transporter, partial [Methanomassiliicoccales archaeon]|nr:MFS transporter [Methanomassiliicoccales archaeon]
LAVAGDSLVAHMAFRSFRSQSMGMYNSVRGISTIVGSILGGLVAQMLGYAALFTMTSVFIVAALILLFTTDVEGESEEPPTPQTVNG